MKIGDIIRTPRFLSVRIAHIFESEREAREAGFTEPTHYREDPLYGINGRAMGLNQMEFGAFKK